MALNYAVVEFYTDNSIDVVNINEIVDCCDIFLKEGTVVKVCYKKKGSGAGSQFTLERLCLCMVSTKNS